MFDPFVLRRPGTILLDTGRPNASNRASWCFTAPVEILTAETLEEVPDVVDAVEAATADGAYVAGFLAYEAGYPFVDLEAPVQSSYPLAWFGVYEKPRLLAPVEVEDGLSTLQAPISVHDVEFDVERAPYEEAVQAARRHIRRGDVYQINYTGPVRFDVAGDPRVLYRRLRARQHVPYGAYLNLGEVQILSCSPELFFRRRDRRVTARPMKGTIRRGRTLTEDEQLQEELATDPKNRAENLMIVDLLRNDLSVCCEPGSVQVPALYTTEPYDTVTQMTSTVEGQLRPDQGLADLFRALFPCGSVTGAPKRRAMRIIRDLEPEPRGVYCGAIGMAGPDDSAVFNVAIRTAVVEGNEGTMGVGSGIVWDSAPDTEYEECRLKTEFLTGTGSDQHGPEPGPLRLIETMRFDGLRFPLLDQHVERLRRSADYFQFYFDEERFRRRVQAAVREAGTDTTLKVRVTLDRWGRISVTTSEIDSSNSGPWELVVASERVDRTDPLFYHKTTHRNVYDRALEAAQAEGYDEALLLNEEGEVTEGCYTNIFVRRGEKLWTPPVDCGLLAGVYREYVLTVQQEASERVLSLDDLRGADGLYCCNAVRGWNEAVLAADPVPSSGD